MANAGTIDGASELDHICVDEDGPLKRRSQPKRSSNTHSHVRGYHSQIDQCRETRDEYNLTCEHRVRLRGLALSRCTRVFLGGRAFEFKGCIALRTLLDSYRKSCAITQKYGRSE